MTFVVNHFIRFWSLRVWKCYTAYAQYTLYFQFCSTVKDWLSATSRKAPLSKNTLRNNLPCSTLNWYYCILRKRKEMKPETMSKGSDRKLVLFVLCGTRYFIKPVYVRYILYTMLLGLWAQRKHVHSYEKRTWHHSKRYVIILFLTGTSPQTQ